MLREELIEITYESRVRGLAVLVALKNNSKLLPELPNQVEKSKSAGAILPLVGE